MKGKKKKYLILLVVFIIAISTGAIILSIYNGQNNLLPSDNLCIKKGNVCSLEEIKSGLVVPVKVNDKETYDFYVIDNTQDDLTLIMSKNVANATDWNMEDLNFKGPVTPLFELYDYTSNWKKIPTIENYVYEDYGLKDCELSKSSYGIESCDGYGYVKVVIDGLKSYVDCNMSFIDEKDGKDYLMYDVEFKSRPITLEEIEKLEHPKWLSDNLKNGEGYWTMTSSTSPNVGFSSGAYALVKNEDSVMVESLRVSADANQYKVGVRPVITIPKEA